MVAVGRGQDDVAGDGVAAGAGPRGVLAGCEAAWPRRGARPRGWRGTGRRMRRGRQGEAATGGQGGAGQPAQGTAEEAGTDEGGESMGHAGETAAGAGAIWRGEAQGVVMGGCGNCLRHQRRRTG